MKQEIQSSHMLPCHRHMVIATTFSVHFFALLHPGLPRGEGLQAYFKANCGSSNDASKVKVGEHLHTDAVSENVTMQKWLSIYDMGPHLLCRNKEPFQATLWCVP